MAFLVTSKSSPVLSNASRKEEVPNAVMSMDSTGSNPDNSLLRHYSLLSSSFLIEEDSLIESLPSLYFNEDDKKEDTEGDDTEEDDDDYTTAKEQKTPPADFTNMTSCLIKKAASAASAAAPLFPASCSSQSTIPPPIQTYSPQLNLSLYSPSPSVASSIRSTRKSRSSSSNSHHSYSLASSAAAAPSIIKSSCASASAAFASSSAARNPTLTSFNNIKRQTPLYSTATISSSSKIASTIKMDIRSPPQPSQSTSRFMNAFHRFRNSASSSANTNNQKNAPYHNHHQNTTNSVAPAEIVSTMKPSPSKSSLADKIKSKFHQQLDKKKNRASLVELSTKKKALSNFSMPRSASLSSMTNWSSRLSGGNSNKSTPLKKGINVHNDKLKLSHSASVSSRLSMSSSLSSSSSCSSTSSSSRSLNHSSRRSAGDASSFMPPQTATSSTPATSSSAFSLTKSISSHRLYNKSSSEASSSNSDACSSSRHSLQAVTRPRQPLRAVNPNDSVRFVMRQSSPMSASSNSRKSSLQQQKHQKTIVRFSKLVSVRETYSKTDYDRGSDPDAVCTRLTPAMAQQIKEELNAYKLHEMQVHEYSRVHTHFFI
ncbi:hypothetical protein MBANPS3_000212 [Mucor bainieri]